MLVPDGKREDGPRRREAQSEVSAAPRQAARLERDEPAPVRTPALEKGAGEPDPASTAETEGRERATSSAPSGWTWQGRVVDVAGVPLPSVQGSIRLVDKDGREREVYTHDGEFRFEGLPPGRWWLKPDLLNLRGETLEVFLRGGGGVWEQDLVVQPASALRILATTPEGRSLVSFLRWEDKLGPTRPTAVATRTRPDGDRLADLTPIGNFQAHPSGGLELGTLEFEEPEALYVSLVLHDMVLATLLAPPGTQELTFRIDPNEVIRRQTTLRFELVEAHTGQPVEFCMVSLRRGKSHMARGMSVQDRGVFEIEDWPIGPVEVRVFGQAYEAFEATFDLVQREVNDLGVLPIQPATLVRGRLVPPPDLAAESLAEANLSFDRVDAEDDGRPDVTYGRTANADGSFELALGPGRYRIWARVWIGEEELRSPHVYVDTERDALSDVRVPLLHQAELVARPDLSVPDGAWIVLRDLEGYEWARRQVENRAPLLFQLPPGEYQLEIEDEEGSLGGLSMDLLMPGVDLQLSL